MAFDPWPLHTRLIPIKSSGTILNVAIRLGKTYSMSDKNINKIQDLLFHHLPHSLEKMTLYSSVFKQTEPRGFNTN